MQALNDMIKTIGTRMRELSMTARLLIGALMVIMVMALLLVSMLAGRSDMSALPVTLTAEARTKAVNFLDNRDIKWVERGGQLMVPKEQKYAVLAQLTDEELVDPDQIDFNSLVQDDNPFADTRSKRRKYLIAKMNVLARTISQMDGITRATVVIDEPPGRPGIGRSYIAPGASVTVTPQGAEFNQARVDAIANLVAGAHAGLKVSNVKIIDARTGRLCQPRTEEESSGGRYYERKLEAERHTRNTIMEALEFIRGVRIAVNAQVDTRQVHEQRQLFEDPKIGPVSEQSRTVNSSNQSQAGQAGVRPNTGTSIVAAPGRQSTLSDERTEASTVPVFPSTRQEIVNRTGYALQINASIGVPKSYFVQLYRDRQGDETAEPDQAALDALVSSETAQIQTAVEPLVDTGAIDNAIAGTVTVYMFPDFALAASVTNGGVVGEAGVGGGSDGGLLSGGLVRTVGLGGLAVLSLAMMFLMVRKASVQPDLPSAEELVGVPPALAAADSDIVGEAGELDQVLEGLEIDEDSVRQQQILDQINKLAKSEPDEMASLVRRWVKTEP